MANYLICYSSLSLLLQFWQVLFTEVAKNQGLGKEAVHIYADSIKKKKNTSLFFGFLVCSPTNLNKYQ